MTVTVTAPLTAAPPVVAAIAPQAANSGKTVILAAVATGGTVPLKYTWAQSSGVPQPVKQSGTNPAAIEVTHALATNQVTNDVLVYTVVAIDSTNAMSAPVPATITYTPVPDRETVTLAEYRIGKQRLDLTITSSAINPAVVLKLAPYSTTGRQMFDPAGTGNTFVTAGGGIYTLVLVGVPQPAGQMIVSSNIAGTTGQFPLTKVRP